jgi:outer membrane receptor protein involved in Fe transport
MKSLLRTALLTSAATVLLAPAMALAQPAADGEVSELVVTGSRIPRDTFDAPQPVQVIDSERLRESGQLSLGDILFEIPSAAAATNAQNSSTSLFFAGQARADLRGLGPARTLVLVDGRRHIFSDASSPAVDLNMIPQLLVDHVDIVAGGASAVYGSEAIAGVVNIIMRKNLDGFEGDIRVGTSEEGDGEEFRIGAAYGRKLMDDRLNVIVGGEISRSEPIMQRDRDWAYPGLRRNNTVTPQTVVPASRNNQTPFGTFQLRPTIAVTHDMNNPSQIVPLTAPCATATVSALCQDSSLFYSNVYGALQNRVERGVIRGYADYAVTDKVKVFGEVSYAKVDGYSILSPAFSTATGALPMPIVIRGDNAFLLGAGTTAAQLRAAWTAAALPFTSATTANVARYYPEFGGRNVDANRDTLRLVGGMQGEFDAAGRTVNWDWYAQYGEMNGKTVTTGVPNVLRLQQAVDAVTVGGQVVCRDVTAQAQGCVPFDLVNTPSQAAVAWANGVSYTDQTVKQTVVSANFNTDLFELPAGSVGVAAGAEYRKEESSFVQDPLSAAGALFQNVIGTRAGEYDVTEGYAEVRVPLLRGLPLIDSLSVEAAGRLANYSTIGATDQYRLAFEWAPVRDILIRGSQGTAVRAPNIPELFAPQGISFTSTAQDPCDRLIYAGATAAQKAARQVTCAAAIAGWNPATFNSNIGTGRPLLRLLSGGNPNLGPETAHTYQLGVTVRPRMIPGFKASLDFFKYNIAGGITPIPVNTVLQALCYDSSAAYQSNPFCAQVVRDPTGATTGNVLGGVSIIDSTQQNASKVKVEGYDYSMAYGFEAGSYGRLDLRFDATWTYRFALQGLPNQPYAQLIGTLNNNIPPEWKATGSVQWTYNALSLGWTTRYIGSMIASNAFLPTQLSPYKTGDHYEHDLRVKYRFSEQVDLRGGVVNLTDETPPLLPESYTGATVGSSSYDNRGRYFYVGATFRY